MDSDPTKTPPDSLCAHYTPGFMKLVYCIARKYLKIYPLKDLELEDLVQIFHLEIWMLAPSWNPQLASYKTFACRAMWGKFGKLIRESQAPKRLMAQISLEASCKELEAQDLELYAQTTGLRNLGNPRESDLAEDFARAMASLKPRQQVFLRRLANLSMSEIVCLISKTTYYDTLKEIRNHFTKRGLHHYLTRPLI